MLYDLENSLKKSASGAERSFRYRCRPPAILRKR